MGSATRVHPDRRGVGLLRTEDGQRTVGRLSRPRNLPLRPRGSASRRPGTPLGRRLGLALVLALLACATSASTAAGDPAVVSWTVYPASGGSVSSGSLSLSTLDSCPLYSGSSPIYLYDPPNAPSPYSPSSTSSWSLSTVLTCGLGVPLSDVTNAQVDSPSHGFETALTSVQLSDPSQWHDPDAPDALPVISQDGTDNQNTYVRPWLGGSDDNAADHVVQDGAPIAIVVYENGPPLTVHAAAQTVSEMATQMTVEFSATVENPDGTTVPSSNLSWAWNYGDGGTSIDAAPEHSFVVQGVYAVTVQVTDNATGQGGTDTIPVSFSTSSATGPSGQTGAGTPTGSHSPTGLRKSRSSHPAAGRAKAGSSTTPHGGSSNPTAQTSTQASTDSTTSSSPPAHASPAQTTSPARHPAAHHRATRTSRTVPAGSSVTGRLLSDVTPLPEGASPLVHAIPAVATAPAVRGAIRASSLPYLAAGLAVVLLFGLGVWRELRGRRDWRALRLPE